MCRYGFKHYKTHYACFVCRKSFKKQTAYVLSRGIGFNPQWPVRTDAEWQVIEARDEEMHLRLLPCPQCRGDLADLGRDFKPPRTTDLGAWRMIAATYRLGHAWHTCGCNGPGFIPASPSGYRTYLVERLKEYRAAAAYVGGTDTAETREQRHYWSTRVSAVEHELTARGHHAPQRRSSGHRPW